MTEPRFDLNANALGAKLGKRFQSVSVALMQSQALPKTLTELVELRASQINGCGYCTDAHAKDLAAAGESATRINLVAVWRETTVFTEAERAALAFAEEGTRLADTATGVSDETWAQVRAHFDDDQIAALIYVISCINAANRMLVITKTKGGSYVPGTFESIAAAAR
ncbi:AhpD family alkylhydroperoxidase [Nocardia tenerifensis]|uniref:AhpD family alkylhydroperoxidase n=1 Tax=Nocardia tenerifensis TaxID=228006 RepID=A0A318K308_9NOCA|nr:carboxymuconolactone decarboxylase family protein [Nocardia tenerifensis]PXX62201.1 AhpD family alkylhydroperoxidase [Nocardia tenerifensis]